MMKKISLIIIFLMSFVLQTVAQETQAPKLPYYLTYAAKTGKQYLVIPNRERKQVSLSCCPTDTTKKLGYLLVNYDNWTAFISSLEAVDSEFAMFLFDHEKKSKRKPGANKVKAAVTACDVRYWSDDNQTHATAKGVIPKATISYDKDSDTYFLTIGSGALSNEGKTATSANGYTLTFKGLEDLEGYIAVLKQVIK